MRIKECSLCNKSYSGRNTSKYCSRECSSQAPKKERNCKVCGKIFPTKTNGVCCSKECKIIRKGQKNQEWFNKQQEQKRKLFATSEEARIKNRIATAKYYNKVDNDVRRDRHLKWMYGIGIEDYKKMLNEQNGVCAICKKTEPIIVKKTGLPKSLAVDHCHTTNKIRGLLCACCNTVLGKFNDYRNGKM